ncbi:MAG TPA: tetratricopeptide repeat protein [Candidatus Omnitrophota bacterium]|nr:tetratricopeptide repeat protein [Candidatus Omnitrophota bacterium]
MIKNILASKITLSIILFSLILGIFWPATGFKFLNYDDVPYVAQNHYLNQGVTPKGARWAFLADLTFDSLNTDYWQPMTALSHMLDFQIWKSDAGGHHLSNLILHAFNTVFLFLLFAGLTSSPWKSLWLALLFGLHPVQIQPVAWITARKDVLAVFWGILTLLCYSKYVKKPSFGRIWLSVFCFALSLMSKPVLVTLPVILLILDYWPLNRLSFRFSSVAKRLAEKLPWIVLSGISCGILLVSRSETIATGMKDYFFHQAGFSYLRYLWKAIEPFPLAIRYPDLILRPWENFEAWVFFLALSGWIIRKSAKSFPFLAAGWLWFFVTLLPSVGLNLEDRYFYFPMIGLSVCFVWGISAFLEKFRTGKFLLAGIAFAQICAYAVFLRPELKHWKNTNTIFRHALRVTRNNSMAHNVYASALMEAGRKDEAIRHFTKAIFLKHDFAEAHNNLASALAGEGKYPVALTHYAIALDLLPDFALAHNNLAIALADLGRTDEAVSHLRKALEINPQFEDARFNLASILLRQNQFEEAAREYETFLGLNPKDAQAHNDFGVILRKQGKPEEAAAHFREALRLRPDDLRARKNLEGVPGKGSPANPKKSQAGQKDA